MNEMSRAGAHRAADPGPPTSSSARREGAPGGADPAPALDAQSEAEVAGPATAAPLRLWSASASDPHPSHWRPAFVDNDARDVPSVRETVKVNGGVL